MNKQDMEKYFSQWFEIIPFDDVKQLYEDGDRSILILTPDGTDRYIDGYTLKELEKEHKSEHYLDWSVINYENVKRLLE